MYVLETYVCRFVVIWFLAIKQRQESRDYSMPYNWFSWNQSIIPTRNNFGGYIYIYILGVTFWWTKTFKSSYFLLNTVGISIKTKVLLLSPVLLLIQVKIPRKIKTDSTRKLNNFNFQGTKANKNLVPEYLSLFLRLFIVYNSCMFTINPTDLQVAKLIEAGRSHKF